ncbi:MAG: hypothetical protein KGH58_03495 [Candidatus Micrarchaeota archaeon]|nr:hypothetical protein [Candidatus Micrarchaeota archaeon]
METSRSRSRVVDRSLTIEIKAKSNALPFRSLLYAMSHARSKIGMTKAQVTTIHLKKLSQHEKIIHEITKGLDANEEPDPNTLYKHIKGATANYVNLFYALTPEERTEYIARVGRMRFSRLMKPEENLLMIPAINAELKEQKSNVINTIANRLYRSSFKVLYDSSKSALHVALLERNMAIKSVPDHMLKGFSKVMSKMDEVIKYIDTGLIDAKMYDEIKNEFIADAVNFSAQTEIGLVNVISERINTDSVRMEKLYRMSRRNRH